MEKIKVIKQNTTWQRFITIKSSRRNSTGSDTKINVSLTLTPAEQFYLIHVNAIHVESNEIIQTKYKRSTTNIYRLCFNYLDKLFLSSLLKIGALL